MKKRKKKVSFKIVLASAVFFCFLAGLAYFLIWHPFLSVKKIEIKSEQKPKYYLPEQIEEIIQGELEGKLWRFIPQKSVLLIPEKRIKENIFSRFPEIKSIEIDRKIPDFLEVGIIERESIGIWCQVEYLEEKTATSSTETRERRVKKCFNIDQEGIVFKESPLIHGKFVLNIYQNKEREIKLREEVTTSQTTKFILAAREGLPKIKTTNDLSLSSVDFEIFSNEDLRVKTNLGFEIYFNQSYAVDSQLEAIEIILSDQIKEDFTSLTYIDLRIEGRVYYK